MPIPPSPSRINPGFGLGLRPDHYHDLETRLEAGEKPVDWVEALAENYMVPGGAPLHHLDRVARHLPVVLHGVSLSIGSTDTLDADYLDDLQRLIDRVHPLWVSDHLCWTGVMGKNMHDLLPLPYTEEALQHVSDRIDQVQTRLQRPILIENVSSYVSYADSALTEWEFLAEIVARTGCKLLLDVNNIYVSSFNHGFAATDFLDGIPHDAVWQIHLAGHTNNGDHIIDTHDHDVPDPVLDLYEAAIRRTGPVATMIERDGNIPPLADLLTELDTVRRRAVHALGEAA